MVALYLKSSVQILSMGTSHGKYFSFSSLNFAMLSSVGNVRLPIVTNLCKVSVFIVVILIVAIFFIFIFALTTTFTCVKHVKLSRERLK